MQYVILGSVVALAAAGILLIAHWVSIDRAMS